MILGAVGVPDRSRRLEATGESPFDGGVHGNSTRSVELLWIRFANPWAAPLSVELLWIRFANPWAAPVSVGLLWIRFANPRAATPSAVPSVTDGIVGHSTRCNGRTTIWLLHMDFSHYSDSVVQMAVDLVNTFEKSSAADHLTTVEDLHAFLEQHRDEWHDDDWGVPAGPTEADLAEVRALRERLRAVWDIGTVEGATPTLNDLLADTAATPRISLHHGRPHMHFEPRRGKVSDWLGSAAAMALSVVVVDHGYERFGICDSATCEDVYVDTSRNMSRRHCSTTCTTRENVAAHRRRAKSTA